MSLKSYPAHRPVDMAWVTRVPKHWQVTPLFTVVSEQVVRNTGMKEDNLLSLSYGRVVRKDIKSSDGLLPESFETYQIVEPGSIVLRLTDLQNDQRSLRTGYVNERGIITSAYLALSPKGVDPLFLAHLMRAYDHLKVFYSMGSGLRQSLKFSDLRRLPVIVPPLEEQRQIAAFLDHETSRIGALLREQERLIQLLQEKHDALISHEVAGAHDANVPTKAVAAGNLKEIPEHWRSGPLKRFVATRITDGPHETPVFVDNGVPFLSAEAVKNGSLDFGRRWGTISPQLHAMFGRKCRPRRNDVLMVKAGNTTGAVAMVDSDADFSIWSPLALIRPNPNALASKFLFFTLLSSRFQAEVALKSNFGTQPNIGMRTLENLHIAVPPLSEQQEIVERLESVTGRLEALISEARVADKLLRERRESLISAAVTGQIDTRFWTAEASAEAVD